MGLQWAIQTLDSVTSTQDIVKTEAQDDAPEGLLVRAQSQSGGRGRHGRVWESPPGNLYFSMLLRPACEARLIGQISLLCGLAMGEAMRSFMDDPSPLMLKWPNDILIGGQKCAGQLLESELSSNGSVAWIAAGLGVNVVHAPQGAALNAFAADANSDALLDTFLARFKALYGDWQSAGFEDIRGQWLEIAHPQGSRVSVKTAQGVQSGEFHDIDEYGNLRLKGSGAALKTISAGDLYLESA